MGKKLAPLEVSSFVGGLVSDANALTFPQNASLDEDNVVLNLDGSRNRRLGMDFEDSAVQITTAMASTGEPAHTSFKWENAGGDPDKTLLVVQFGNELKFFDQDNVPLSSTVLYTSTLDVASFSVQYSYANVDGTLVVVNGEKLVNIYTYSSGTITKTTDYIKVRDLWGVEAIISGSNLREGNNISKRPSTKNDAHIYNLRNQSWGIPRPVSVTTSLDDTNPRDPIQYFYDDNFFITSPATKYYPSNADTVNQVLYPDATLASGRTLDRVFIPDLIRSPLGSYHAASGYFIIDALERGTSRASAYSDLMSKYNKLTINITSLPLDKTTGGPSIVSQFAGRIWYGGFSGAVTSGDSKSPKLSSYVMFSQLVEDTSDITKCYQEGDPTSKESPDLLDTDGGFIRIDEAFGIKAMVASGSSLFVFAQNGVWRITGDMKGSGFTATNYSVFKLSEVGCIGPSSVVQANGSVFFWGDDGIHAVTLTQVGEWNVVNLIQGKLQNFYNDISSKSKESAQGFYDGYEYKIRWVYDNILLLTSSTRELVFDVQLKAFTVNTIKTTATGYPKLVGIYESPPFRVTPGTEDVVVSGVNVVVGVNQVINGVQTRSAATREVGYITITSVTSTIKYKFCSYSDITFRDWYSYDSVGVDSPAYILTGYVNAGNFQNEKQAPFLTMYMKKTETGFTEDVNGDFSPANVSSVKVQTQWDWTNSESSNRWGREFQAYRHRRLYIPTDVDDQFNDGNDVVVTKNKLRGKGKVLSIKLSSEPLKDFHVLGWSFKLGIMTDV